MRKLAHIVLTGLLAMPMALRAGNPVISGAGHSMHVSGAPFAAPEAEGDFERLALPLKRAGNLFLIEAEIDSIRGNFILDLGAPYLVLNSTYFRNYKVDYRHRAGTLNSANNHVRRTEIRNLKLSALEFNNIQADVTDLGTIENQRGVQILGLLGVRLFAQLILELDLRGQQLVLHRTESTLDNEAPASFDLPMRIHQEVLLVRGKLNGKKMRYSLDTGAELSILDQGLPNSAFGDMEILRRTEVIGADGEAVEMLVALVEGYELNGVELVEMRTLIADLRTMSRAYGTSIDGILGYPFFAQGRMIIDFKNERLKMYRWKGAQQ